MFVLPAVLLALLVGCLTWASLHQEAQTTTSPAPTPSVTVPHAIAAAPPKVHTAPSVSCRVDYEMLAQWVFGFTAEVTIVNTGTSAIAGWTLRFDLQPGQTVGGGWSGQWKQDGSAVTVSDATYNGAVPPGGSVMIGFVGNQSGNTPAAPTHFTLNGAACN